MTRRQLAPLLLAVLAAIAAPRSSGGAAGEGAVSGTVRYEGKVPAREPIAVTADKGVCGKKEPILDESLLVGDKGGLRNAIVWVEGVKAGAAPATATAVLDQVNCVYTPHVQALVVGSTLELVNSDATLHNVHSYLDGDSLFNLGLPAKRRDQQTLDEPGILSIKCDAGHTWMSAYVGVFEHRWFAVTDATGAFSIPALPSGTYTLRVWHEKLGTRSSKLTVAGRAVTVDIRYPAR